MHEREITSKEAASILSVSESRIWQLLSEGRIQGRKEARDWRIDRESVIVYQQSRRKAGRPRKKE